MLGLPLPDLLRGDAVGERAAGPGLRDQHGPVRGEDLGGFGHEVDPGEHDHARRARRRQPRQRERVPDMIRDILDLGHLVVVRQDHRIPLPRQPPHLPRPLRRGLRLRTHHDLPQSPAEPPAPGPPALLSHQSPVNHQLSVSQQLPRILLPRFSTWSIKHFSPDSLKPMRARLKPLKEIGCAQAHDGTRMQCSHRAPPSRTAGVTCCSDVSRQPVLQPAQCSIEPAITGSMFHRAGCSTDARQARTSCCVTGGSDGMDGGLDLRQTVGPGRERVRGHAQYDASASGDTLSTMRACQETGYGPPGPGTACPLRRMPRQGRR